MDDLIQIKKSNLPIDHVCLIIPPSIFLLDERVFMALGILKVAATLEESGLTVEVLDLSGVENYEDAVKDYVKISNLTWYGISATTPQMPATTKILNAIRLTNPGAKIVLGGPHATLVHAACKTEKKRGIIGRASKALNQLTEMFDSLVTGDGEIAIFETLKSDPPKIVDGDDPKTELFLNNKTLNSLPFPARHLIDVDSYHYQIDGHRALSIIAQLGCPFPCGFCFSGETKIITSYGPNKKIKDVKIGDRVITSNDGVLEEGVVKNTFERQVDRYLRITLENGTVLKVTHEHSFYMYGNWIEARDLKIGDILHSISPNDKISFNKKLYNPVYREDVKPKISKIEEIQKELTMYNFECDNNNYFAEYILVHNCGGRLSPSLRRIRMRTSENIVQEMTHVYKTYGVTGFMFYDDELNVNTKIVELMNMIAGVQKELNVEFRLRGFVKSELFTEEQAEVMYRAGFRWILVGFESGHDRILTNIQKKASREDNTRAMSIARKYGLKVKALMSVGHPGESVETIKATRDWLVEVKPADFDVTVITTYPGSPYFDEAVEIEPGVWTYTCPKNFDRIHSQEVDYREVSEYYKGVPGEYISYVHTDYLSSAELVKWRDWIEEDVRKTLNISYNVASPSVRYEHSMGQQGTFPNTILNTTRK